MPETSKMAPQAAGEFWSLQVTAVPPVTVAALEWWTPRVLAVLPLFWVTACHAANPPHPIRAVPATTRTKTIPARSFLRSELFRSMDMGNLQDWCGGRHRLRSDGGEAVAALLVKGGAALALAGWVGEKGAGKALFPAPLRSWLGVMRSSG